MQYIEDDMDELFRRAAEDYPLNTDSADWNEVVRKLSADDPEKTNIATVNKKNYKRLLLLLLLLPITWIGYDYFNSHNQNHKNLIAEKKVSKNILPSTTYLNTIKENINLQPATALQVLPGNHQSIIQTVNPANKNNIHYAQKGLLHSVQSAPQTDNSSISSNQPSSPFEDVNKKEEPAIVLNNENGVNIKTGNENVTTDQPVTTKKENDTIAVSVKTKKQKAKKGNGMYAGIFISPDFSSVKFQSVKNTGVTTGLLIGYRLNKKISVETGVAWNKKYYYSDGEYFNTKKIVLPANARILKLDGVCKMIEVPVTIRYDFKSSVKTNLSVSGGVSSYIMKSENYNYTIENTGVQYPRSADYKNSSTNLLAVAVIGFGYNRTLGKGAMLRLEPYIKIPVTGVGIGKLPIMSSGMNIGITKKIF